MQVIAATDSPQFEVPGTPFTGLASPSRGSSEIGTWRIRVAADLHSPASHTLDRDEIFMISSGAIQVSPGGPLVGAGDAAVVPARTPIQLVNAHAERAEVYVVVRADFTGTFENGSTIHTPPWAR
jgi:mannose-6-phosphate isomerase-like protein (cupin superfamily)